MPIKKSVDQSSDHDVISEVSSLPAKILASDEVQDMDIDGPAVITEVIPGSDLGTSDHNRYSSSGLDQINELQVELNKISQDDRLPDEIMDASEDQTDTSASILPEVSTENISVERGSDALPDTLLSIFPETKETATVSSSNNITTVTEISSNASPTKKVIVKQPSSNSVEPASLLNQSSINQQIRFIPVSQTSGNIPLQLIQGQGTSSTHIVLTSVPGSSNKAVLKPLAAASSVASKQSATTTVASTLLSPTKQGVVLGKVLSPSKSPGKITMIPMTLAKNSQVQKFLPTLGSGAQTISLVGSSGISVINSSKPTVVTASELQKVVSTTAQQSTRIVSAISPTKMIQVHGQLGSGPVIARLTSPTIKQVASVSAGNLQGNKLQFIRLVSSTGGKTNATLLPVSTIQTSATKVNSTVSVSSSGISTPVATVVRAAKVPVQNPVRMTIPIAPAVQGQNAQRLTQKVLIPAPSVSRVTPIRQNISASNLSQLPPGATLISTGGNNSPGIVMVPAQYLNQLQPTTQPPTIKTTIAPRPSTTPPPAASDAEVTKVSPSSIGEKPGTFSSNSTDANGLRQRKPCNCTKSQCLKLYCDCFANGEFCNNCNCNHCFNNLDHEEDRQKAIKSCLDRNPQAFHPKIGKGRGGEIERRHNKGCNCKRSGCSKNYCECYEAKISCTDMCKCVGCKNYEESVDRKSLMHLADAAEVRVQQQTDATNKFSIQMKDLPSRPATITSTGEKLPFSFVTKEVVNVTCQCLLAQAEEAKSSEFSEVETQKVILEELGRCLKRIIEFAHKTKFNTSDL